MQGRNTINYLQHNEIDKNLWDQCIDKADNGLVYGYSTYLDHIANEWDALVLNNYEAVMPLPWRKKFGIYYLYQPFFTAQLGVFGNDVDAYLLQKFLHSIPSKFQYWDISLNHYNLFAIPPFNICERVNYVLDLQHSHIVLQNNYNENTRRNIKKSQQNGCYTRIEIDVAKIIDLAKQQTEDVSENDFKKFENLYKEFASKELAKTYGIYSDQNELLSSAVFFFSHNRAYYILAGNNANGKTPGASHAMINAFIKDHAEKKLILDFEGSDISSVAFFYKGFGASEENYAAIKLNRLPWYARWLKK